MVESNKVRTRKKRKNIKSPKQRKVTLDSLRLTSLLPAMFVSMFSLSE